MEKKELFAAFLNDVSGTQIALLLLAGILFGMAYTYTHFWSIKKFVIGATNVKGALFFSTFIRLAVFMGALWLVSQPNHAGVRVMIFFVGFMMGRIPFMRLARKELKR